MKACPREIEILEAIESREWSEDLTAHLRECSVCEDLAEVAEAFSGDYAAILSDARIPPAALVWWRAELEARHEATRKATRPITLVHAFAVACTLGVALALGRELIVPGSETVWSWVGRLVGAATGYMPTSGIAAEPAVGDIPIGLTLLLVVGCCLMVAPLAAYFIFSDD